MAGAGSRDLRAACPGIRRVQIANRSRSVSPASGVSTCVLPTTRRNPRWLHDTASRPRSFSSLSNPVP